MSKSLIQSKQLVVSENIENQFTIYFLNRKSHVLDLWISREKKPVWVMYNSYLEGLDDLRYTIRQMIPLNKISPYLKYALREQAECKRRHDVFFYQLFKLWCDGSIPDRLKGGISEEMSFKGETLFYKWEIPMSLIAYLEQTGKYDRLVPFFRDYTRQGGQELEEYCEGWAKKLLSGVQPYE